MNSKIDQMDLKNGLKGVLKNVGKNIGKIQEFKNIDISKNNDMDSKVAGVVWEKKEDELTEEIKLKNEEIVPSIDVLNSNNKKAEESLKLELDNLQRTTVFSDKLYMWIS